MSAKSAVSGALETLVDDRIWRDWGTEQPRSDVGYSDSARLFASFACHGSGGANADRCLVPAKAVSYSPDQHGHVSALAASICVEFVQNEEIQALGVGDDGTIPLVLPSHQQLKHHEIR